MTDRDVSLKYYRDLKNSLDTAELEGYTKAEKAFKNQIEIERRQKEEERRQKEIERRQKEEERRQKEKAIAKEKEALVKEKEALAKEKEAIAKEKKALDKVYESARQMKKYGMPVDAIAKATGLLVDEIEKL